MWSLIPTIQQQNTRRPHISLDTVSKAKLTFIEQAKLTFIEQAKLTFIEQAKLTFIEQAKFNSKYANRKPTCDNFYINANVSLSVTILEIFTV